MSVPYYHPHMCDRESVSFGKTAPRCCLLSAFLSLDSMSTTTVQQHRKRTKAGEAAVARVRLVQQQCALWTFVKSSPPAADTFLAESALSWPCPSSPPGALGGYLPTPPRCHYCTQAAEGSPLADARRASDPRFAQINTPSICSADATRAGSALAIGKNLTTSLAYM